MGHIKGRDIPLVSVIIVNFNSGRLLTETVHAALRSTVPVEVLVSDNGSWDTSIRQLRSLLGNNPRLRIMENRRNLGFARASNLAISQGQGEFVLLLNPDCVIQPDTIERMIATMEIFPEAGMAGCLIRSPDGSEQPGCRRAVPSPWRTFVRVLHLNKFFPNSARFRSFVLNREPLPRQSIFLEAISGAFMLVRRNAMKQVGLLDEAYFLHCEDLDWCMRFRQAGWQILFVPQVEVTHHKGACSAGRPVRVLWHKHKGMIHFYRKFFHQQYKSPLMVVVVTAVWSRFSVLAFSAILRRFFAYRPHKPTVTVEPMSMKPQFLIERRDESAIPGYIDVERRTKAGYEMPKTAQGR